MASITKVIKLYEEQNGLCRYCKDKLCFQKSVHVDHIIPKSKGGTLEYGNCALTCSYCNLKKRDKDEEFIVKWIKPYLEGEVNSKKDLGDYNKYIELKQRFNS